MIGQGSRCVHTGQCAALRTTLPARSLGAPRHGSVSQDLTYIGRETITVPAGTFATCHVKWVRRLSADSSRDLQSDLPPMEQEEWWVAEGPYKGVIVQLRNLKTQVTSRAAAVQADWK